MTLLLKLAEYLNPSDLNIPKGSPGDVLGTVMKIVFSVAGAISLVVIVIAALRLVLSGGNPEGLNRTRNTLIYAAIGLIVCLMGFAIVSFVVNNA